jgi:hypothetical protein
MSADLLARLIEAGTPALLVAEVAMKLAEVDLGIVDSQGRNVTSLVIDRTEDTAPLEHESNDSRPAAKEYALRILEKLLTAEGVLMPKLAKNYPVISEEKWRQECADSSLSDSPKKESQDKAFSRARKTLLDKGLIVAKQGYVWLAPIYRTSSGQSGTSPEKCPFGQRTGHTPP